MLSSIYTFLENDLDFLIHLVTAADTSYVNEVEGIMPLANVVLQNQAYAREKMSDDIEELFKPAGSGKMIRDVITDSIESTENNEALESWRKSLSECKMKMEKRFSKIYYCGNNLQIFSTATDDDIKITHKVISKIDESYDSTPTQKVQMEGKTKKLFHLLILIPGKAIII